MNCGLDSKVLTAALSKTRHKRKAAAFPIVREAWLQRRSHLDALIPKLQKRFEAIPRVVGIDLRSKDHRPTGWALCNGSQSETKVFYTDEEILNATLQAKPDLVSIDAPLFLPRGTALGKRR